MSLSENIRRQLINNFKTEQKEHLQKISQGLLALEGDPSPEMQQNLLNDIFREAHSLKGAARAVGLPVIEGLAHAIEELLLQVREGYRSFSPDLFDLIYQALDGVEVVMEGLEANRPAPANVVSLMARLEATAEAPPPTPEPTPSPGEPVEPSPEPVERPRARAITTSIKRSNVEPRQDSAQLALSGAETIRVAVRKLDTLMTQFGELVGAKTRAEQRLTELRALHLFVNDWQRDWLTSRREYIRLMRLLDATLSQERTTSPLADNGLGGYDRQIVELVKFTLRNQEQLNTLSSQLKQLYRQVAEDTRRLSLAIDDMEMEIKQVRMFPLVMITTTFSRMVRDLAREQGKQANLNLTGSEIELDKRILEQIKDPLIHLLRNAVDHGLEPGVERKRANKPIQGQITLSASQQGTQAIISVSDDGSGLDLAAIRRTAVQKGLLSQAEVEVLSETEVANLIFRSGFSTSPVSTDISGRGVGLDVVRQNVEALQGTLEVSSEPGRGSTFTMNLPLTLATFQGLLISAGQQLFALPLAAVERMLYIEAEALISAGGKPALIYQDKPVAVAWLEDLLELPFSPRERDHLMVVMLSIAEKQLGLIVDDLVNEQELVLKNLGGPLLRVGGVAGATILGSGQIILVLHPTDLIKLAGRISSRTAEKAEMVSQEPAPKPRKTILVVDDSITTRTLEKNILQAAGYRVKVATNGEEALAILHNSADQPHLVISDIAMPRLDGFQLTQRMKQDPDCAHIPVILVTSLDSLEDKARGIEAGADGYVVKSSFDQGDLLEIIEQLI